MLMVLRDHEQRARRQTHAPAMRDALGNRVAVLHDVGAAEVQRQAVKVVRQLELAGVEAERADTGVAQIGLGEPAYLAHQQRDHAHVEGVIRAVRRRLGERTSADLATAERLLPTLSRLAVLALAQLDRRAPLGQRHALCLAHARGRRRRRRAQWRVLRLGVLLRVAAHTGQAELPDRGDL